MEVSQRIKELRERLGLSRYQFAEALGVGKSSVYRWEKEGVIPRYDHAQKLGEISGESWILFTGNY